MQKIRVFLAGPAGCLLSALGILIWSRCFLMTEEQIPIFIYLLSLIAVCSLLGISGLIESLGLSAAKHERLWDVCLTVVMLALICLFRDDHYNLFLLGSIMIYAVAVLGLNVQLGYAGVINFSCASFFGIGSYTAAMLMSGSPTPPFLALLLGGAVSALAGCILILPVLRTSGHYSALVTMAFAMLFRVFMDVSDWFGGPQGIPVPPLTLAGINFSTDLVLGGESYSFYIKYDLLCLLLLLLAFSFVRRLERSWIGLSMDAVRSDETAASCFGVNIMRWKITAFTVGNFMSGLAGATYAVMLSYISPANFTFADSLIFLSILLLGGIGNPWGVILATAIVVIVPEKFQAIQEYRYLIYAALVLLMIVFRPMGLLPRKIRSYTGGAA
jgi:ABC-type branched-subunit amino acid transport system permease subunit